MLLLRLFFHRIPRRSAGTWTTILTVAGSLMACSAIDRNGDDIADLRATIQQQRKEISRLTLALAEQKARVEAMQAIDEMRANVAATRQAIASGAGERKGAAAR